MIDKVKQLIGVSLQWIGRNNRFKRLVENPEPIHILFCMTDHYEPGSGGVSDEEAKGRVDRLITEYPKLTENHKDSNGRKPVRTWFIPPHYHEHNFLNEVVTLCAQGYGEIELHLHHGKECPDTSENLKKTLNLCVEEYSKLGIFGTVNGVKQYGFIHGDWALSNSRNNHYCGVNDEISILKETGCYADYTFPSPNEATPKQSNSIYYAKDDPLKPKSHDTGVEVEVGGFTEGDLMIIQGPLYPYFKSKKPWSLRISGDDIDGYPKMNKRRIDSCIRTGISVKGKENWIIVKMHTHGATDGDAVLGDEMDRIFTYLESKYNDKKNFLLHYVSARELYNVIKALEDGEEGDNPKEFFDYLVKPPAYKPDYSVSSGSAELLECVSKTYSRNK
jgi:hypothetical protein